MPKALALVSKVSQPSSEGSPAWPWEGNRPQERQVGKDSPAAVWTWTHILSEPRVPCPAPSTPGSASRAVSCPVFNLGYATVIFSSRNHEDSLSDSGKTNEKYFLQERRIYQKDPEVFPAILAQPLPKQDQQTSSIKIC